MRPKIKRSEIPYPTEWEEQCAVVKWAEMMVETGQEPRLKFLVGSASGARLTVGNLMKLKRAGVIKKAWPDLHLAVAHFSSHDNQYFSIFIELKRVKGGVLSPEQSEMHKLLRDEGNKVVVCKGADAAIETIRQYLGIDKREEPVYSVNWGRLEGVK